MNYNKTNNYSLFNINNNFHTEIRIELNSLIVGMIAVGLMVYLLHKE